MTTPLAPAVSGSSPTSASAGPSRRGQSSSEAFAALLGAAGDRPSPGDQRAERPDFGDRGRDTRPDQRQPAERATLRRESARTHRAERHEHRPERGDRRPAHVDGGHDDRGQRADPSACSELSEPMPEDAAPAAAMTAQTPAPEADALVVPEVLVDAAVSAAPVALLGEPVDGLVPPRPAESLPAAPLPAEQPGVSGGRGLETAGGDVGDTAAPAAPVTAADPATGDGAGPELVDLPTTGTAAGDLAEEGMPAPTAPGQTAPVGTERVPGGGSGPEADRVPAPSTGAADGEARQQEQDDARQSPGEGAVEVVDGAEGASATRDSVPAPAASTSGQARDSALRSEGVGAASPSSARVDSADGEPAVLRANLGATVAELARVAQRDGSGATRVVIRLDPPELGSVTVALTVRGGDVRVSLLAGDLAAAAALDARRDDVRDALSDAGLALDGYDVQADARQGQERHPDQRARAAAVSRPWRALGPEMDWERAAAADRAARGIWL